MSYLDTYRSLLEKDGVTWRDRNIKRLKHNIGLMAPHSPAYKPIEVNGKKTFAVVKSKDDYFIKEVVSLPDEYIKLGSIVTLFDKPWISLKRDFDDEIYGKSWVYLCNVKLKWKLGDEVFEYDAWAEDATKYSEGVDSITIMKIGEFQLKIKVTLDEYTSSIRRDMRFIIDADKYVKTAVGYGDYPTAFRVTRRNVVTGTYEGEGYVEITMVEDQFVKGKDDYENMLAAQPESLAEPYPPKKEETPKPDKEVWL